MKPLFLLSLLLLSLSLFSAEIKGKAVAVTDGDTITVSDEKDKGNLNILGQNFLRVFKANQG